MAEDWTERYRPKSLNEVVGNPKAIEEMRRWADSWESGPPKHRAIVLIGPPGIGKTSAALAMANDYGWGIVEMNASDQRNADAMRRIALRGAYSDTFTDEGEYLSMRDGFLKLIVLDEADNLFGRQDRGAVPVIVELIKSSRQPVVLIVNDFYGLSRKSSAIKSRTLQIRFNRPRAPAMRAMIKRIAKDQGFGMDDGAINAIVENANGDMRAAVRDLQSISAGKDMVRESDTTSLSDRHVAKTMYQLMDAVLRGTDPDKARSTMRDVDEMPDHVMLWMDENLPLVYSDPGDLVRGYNQLSRADIHLGRVSRRQHYRFWAYASDLMTYGVCTAKRGSGGGYARYRFPGYLVMMSRSKGQRALRNRVCSKIGDMSHTSSSRCRGDILPYLRIMMTNDRELRLRMTRELELEQDELAFVLGVKSDEAIVKDTFKTLGSGPIEDVIEEPVKRTRGNDREQRNLFDF